MTLSLNEPSLVAELTARHDAYEEALAAHDTAALAGYFWDSPHTVRYGVGEHLYGAAAIAAFRQASGGPIFTERHLVRRQVTVFGDHSAVIMCEFEQRVAGQARHSRQSQTWVRLGGEGWRIVAAHVSLAVGAPPDPWSVYATRAAGALGLPVDPEHLPGVVRNLALTASLAESLLAFDLPAETEVAPVFTP